MSREVQLDGVNPHSYEDPNLGHEPDAVFELLPGIDDVVLDPLAELEALLVAMRLQDRHHAREESAAEEELIEQAGEAQVAALHERAEEVWNEGLWSGLSQVGGGLLTGTGGVVGLSVGGDDGNDWSRLFEGLGTATTGVGTLGASAQRADQTLLDADIAQSEAAMAAAERSAEQANADMNAARQSLRDLLNQIQRIHEAELAAQQAAIFAS